MTDMIRKSDALALADGYWQSIGGGLPEGKSDDAIIDTADAIAAAIAALPAVTVGVKPLVWEDRGGVNYVSDRYVVQVFFGSDQYYFETLDLILGRKLYDGDDLPSAKAAAQADYEARILAALEPVAAPDPAAIREAALREAAEAINERGAREQEDFGLTRATQNFFRARDLVRSLIPTKGAADDRA